MAKTKIAVLYTEPETVLEDYRRLFELAGADRALDRNATTILKDNISWHFPMPAANTTPWQLEGAILALKAMGYGDQVCVQNETVVINAFKGEDLNLFRPVFDAYNIPVLYNFREDEIKWIPYKPQGTMLALDRVMEGVGIHIPEYFLGKNIVHLPTFKCHIYTTTTGAMKNAFGGLLNTRRHYTHTWIHETLVDLLAIQKEIHAGVFCAMDGTTAGNGEGPRTHMPEVKNVILAGADQVACDAVSARMMGFDPLSIDYIRLAHGFVYLVAILDWHSRYVLGWSLSTTLEKEFCLEALRGALRRSRPEIFNTDQGAQFTSPEFTGILEGAGIRISMDGRGRVYDNIFVERFWRSVKYEEVYLHEYRMVAEARAQLAAFFQFYNEERPHEALGYRTPHEVYYGSSAALAPAAEAVV